MTVVVEHILLVFLLLQIKHTIADYMVQTKYNLDNIGTYGHPGGLLHAAVHLAGTAVVFALAGAGIAIVAILALIDGFFHYHIDWCKNQATDRLGLVHTDRLYWVMAGIDQALHQATYIALVWIWLWTTTSLV